MVTIKPFKALSPNAQTASVVASLPYDVCNVEEAREYASQPHHFYHITRAEIDLPQNVDVHSQQVYDQALNNLKKFIQEGILTEDSNDAYFLYQLTLEGRSQTGLLCLSSVDDYNNNKIKKHEFTRPEKEKDRIDHMLTLGAQTGVVFLAYRDVQEMNDFVNQWKQDNNPTYDFISDDGVGHKVWKISNEEGIQKITNIFSQKVPATYIADGHHRAASAARVAAKEENNQDAQYFLTCVFPESELKIMDYNRVVKDLNGYTPSSFIEALKEDFIVSEPSTEIFKPSEPTTFGLYLDGKWYSLKAKPGTFDANDPIAKLDVQILQSNVLTKILNINDPRTDKRVDFVGGIRGLKELEKRVNSGDCAAAFSCFPVSLNQLFEVADSGQVMPPKSTWFEPKTRDGLVTYQFRK